MNIEAYTGLTVSRETSEKLNAYVDLLLEENHVQNLIAKSTVDDVWTRHIADSAQLVGLAPTAGRWADIGSGPGLPGMVVAILTGDPVTLIEPRRLRVEFLERVKDSLGLSNVEISLAKVQGTSGRFDYVTARAVAKAGEILGISRHLVHSESTYLLMKGRNAQSELDDLRASWQGRFALVPSRTDPEAAIIVASNVTRGRA